MDVDDNMLWSATVHGCVYEIRRGPVSRPYVVWRDGLEVGYVPSGSQTVDPRVRWEWDRLPEDAPVRRIQDNMRRICLDEVWRRNTRVCEG